MDGIIQAAAHEMHLLPHLQEHAGHARVLADGNVLPVGDLIILHDLIQNAPGNRPVLPGLKIPDGGAHILRQTGVGFHAQPRHRIPDDGYIQLSHSSPSFVKR